MVLSGQRKSYDKYEEWNADFETTTNPDDCRVWAWGARAIDDADSYRYGITIDSFISFCTTANRRIYFHNLGFDGRFILDYLLNEDFELQGPKAKPFPGSFKTLISLDGKFYTITVYWRNGKKSEFRDSYKKLPMSVAHVAKSFGSPDVKGSIDYDAYRPVGHKLTREEYEYLKSDVDIVAHALKQQIDAGLKKLTVGSDALTEFRTGYGAAFSKLFPVIDLAMDAEIRRAYRGGWTIADRRYRGKLVKEPIRVYDVNSLYPSVMYDRVLPYGEPLWCAGLPVADEQYPLFIVSLTFTAHIKPNHVPCIQVKNSAYFGAANYLTVIDEPVTMVVSNVDLALWQEHYELDILSYNGGWQFRGMRGLFTDYIDKWMTVKQTTRGGRQQIAKLMLNALYGKFATNPDVTGKYPILEHGVVRLVKGDEESRNPVYTALGVFITSYARDVTIRAAQRNYDIFLYADTDSLHLRCDSDPENLDIDPLRLGAWKFEGQFEAGMYVRAKCYTEYRNQCNCDEIPHRRGCGYETHIAGLPKNIAETIEFDDLWDGHEFFGKLIPRAVPGGVVLQPTVWRLTDESLPARIAYEAQGVLKNKGECHGKQDS